MCNCVRFRISLNAWEVRIIWNMICMNIYEASIFQEVCKITKLLTTVLYLFIYLFTACSIIYSNTTCLSDHLKHCLHLVCLS
jgi:hypothetical protein